MIDKYRSSEDEKIVNEIMQIADNFSNNGLLTLSEVNTFLRGSKYDYLLKWLKKNWKKLDINSNGGLSKKELCDKRMASRDLAIQGLCNPFMFKNDYLEDLTNQDQYLRPQSDYKNKKE